MKVTISHDNSFFHVGEQSTHYRQSSPPEEGRFEAVAYSLYIDGKKHGRVVGVTYLLMSQIEIKGKWKMEQEDVEYYTRGALRKYLERNGQLPPEHWTIASQTKDDGYDYGAQWNELIDLGKVTTLGEPIELLVEKRPIGFIRSR